jgi:hypothetical protein
MTKTALFSSCLLSFRNRFARVGDNSETGTKPLSVLAGHHTQLVSTPAFVCLVDRVAVANYFFVRRATVGAIDTAILQLHHAVGAPKSYSKCASKYARCPCGLHAVSSSGEEYVPGLHMLEVFNRFPRRLRTEKDFGPRFFPVYDGIRPTSTSLV